MKSRLSFKSRISFVLIFAAFCSFFAVYLIAEDPAPATPVIIATPAAPHPQFLLKSLTLDLQAGTGVLTGDWLDAQGQPVDSGNSVIHLTQLSATPLTETQQQLLAAAIAAATQ